MKKKLALLLASVATVATLFTGCGAKDVSGDYKAEVKIADFMDESELSQMADMGLDMSDITVDVTMNLTEDKDFTIAFDTTSFKEQFSALLDENIDTLIDSSLEMSGVSRDDITDEAAQAMGYDSADALFEDLKTQLSDAMDDAYEDMDKEIEDATVTGTYTVAKDKVVFVTTDDGIGLDDGTIGDDGSITINTEFEDQEFTLVFNAQ